MACRNISETIVELDLRDLGLPGCYATKLPVFSDTRGAFMKFYREDTMPTVLGGFVAREMYITDSAKGVLRGMHFQLPPDDHRKIVVCLSGQVLDVIVDLRASESYGQSASVTLSPEGENVVILPKGVAHGFLSQDDCSRLMYLVETVHAPNSDAGIRWDSFGFDWPVDNPILSESDQAHPAVTDFSRPAEW